MEVSSPRDREVTILTLNVYFGAELAPVYGARDFPELVATVAKIWEHVLAGDIPARAKSLAHQIAAAAPDVVGLQEIARWSIGTPGAMSVRHDFLLLILEALEDEGHFYTPIAIAKNLDQAGPLDMNGNFVHIEDRDAVLLKVAPTHARIRPYNIHTKTFSTLYQPTSAMGSLSGKRSWIAVDASLGDKKFRLIATHIESLDDSTQAAQTKELITESANTASPIIMMGDFNSNAHQRPDVPDNTPTYPDLIAAGFQDAWAAVNPGDPGYTCCHAPDLRNVMTELNRRLDLVLTRGAITPLWAKLVAAEPSARAASGVWPTDHAGVAAKLRFD